MSEEAKQATPHRDLIDQLLDSRIPKSEREHAAAREISGLSVREAHLRARVAELEAENEILRRDAALEGKSDE